MKKVKSLSYKQKLFLERCCQGLSERTIKEYLSTLELMENKTLVIKSKSKFLIAKSVKDKCKKANIKIDYDVKEWNGRGNTTIKVIKDSRLDDTQIDRIIKNLPDTEKGRELALAIKISYLSGLRASEVLSLTSDNIKVNGVIELSIIGKGRKGRNAYLPLTLKNEMANFGGFSIDLSYLEKTFNRVVRKLDIKTNFHSLRHSFALNMLEKGFELNIIQRLLGHSNIATTSIYLQVNDEAVKNALKKIGY